MPVTAGRGVPLALRGLLPSAAVTARGGSSAAGSPRGLGTENDAGGSPRAPPVPAAGEFSAGRCRRARTALPPGRGRPPSAAPRAPLRERYGGRRWKGEQGRAAGSGRRGEAGRVGRKAAGSHRRADFCSLARPVPGATARAGSAAPSHGACFAATFCFVGKQC